MTSQKKSKANRINAQRSTGPRDTKRSRLNARKHGILSSELLIEPEDAYVFEEFSNSMWQEQAPVGPLEEFQVDLLITLAWKLRILNKYEASSIKINRTKSHPDTRPRTGGVIIDTRIPLNGPSLPWFQNSVRYRPPSWEDLTASVELSERVLKALNKKDPLKEHHELWHIVFATAAEQFDVSISDLLGLTEPWDTGQSYSNEQIRQVIEAACNNGSVPEGEFWWAVRTEAHEKHDKASQSLQKRNRELEHQRLLASLPDDKDLIRFQRYEAHLLRQFYQALHELQRMQAKRLGHISSPPMAVDINIDSGPSQ